VGKTLGKRNTRGRREREYFRHELVISGGGKNFRSQGKEGDSCQQMGRKKKHKKKAAGVIVRN